MEQRSYNKNHCCETCSKRTVNGYFRCGAHRVTSDEARENMRKSALKRVKEGRHNNYKASLHYRVLHSWVARNLGKPQKCEHCKKDGLTGHNIHWANKSRNYKRVLTDWIRLCVPCHGAYDSIRS